ncbi:MAG: hypothetical protein GXP10_02020 [Gammaproteobacteria bacterium]|nr:hypothetical protein [Gammaproteobacteria bacterium]
MVNLTLIRDWGVLDLFVLPGFRERTYPGEEGRLRSGLVVDTDQAVYESEREENHVDLALRWSHVIGDWDIGLSHFSGTGRAPRLVPGMDKRGRQVLVPYYDQVEQSGLDLQVTLEEWLWKLEVISRRQRGEQMTAATGGFEYTFVGIFDSDTDLGVLVEYLYDDRGDRATTPFEDDLLVGARFVLNDVQSSELLVGMIVDRDSNAKALNIEGSRRLGDSWTATLELRTYPSVATEDDPLLAAIRNDDYLHLEFSWYY